MVKVKNMWVWVGLSADQTLQKSQTWRHSNTNCGNANKSFSQLWVSSKPPDLSVTGAPKSEEREGRRATGTVMEETAG